MIRPLRGTAEYRACVALQRRTWGETFSELVPPSMLLVAQEMGGVASGAFEGDRLAGFVFGVSGVREGRTAHWSDMLAVDPAYRGRGVGVRLKLHQRERLLELGIRLVLWTFDPLVARNAYLNLRRLGAIAREYRRDVYGASDSPLHAGIGTDRLVAEWHLDSERVRARVDQLEAAAGADRAAAETEPPPPLLSADAGGSFPRPGALTPREEESLTVAVPANIDALKATDLALAQAWRRATREALEWAFGNGYVAVDAARADGATSYYTLSRGF